jgi:hypothetical protein
LVALRAAVAAAAIIALTAAIARGDEKGPPARVEARSSDLLAVGTVQGDRMSIHLSRIIDNSPVRDAAVGVTLRGTAHPALAEADGSYSLQTPDLRLAGPAAVQFEVTQGAAREVLSGTLDDQRGAHSDDKGNTRQLGWWVLNFAVCIGFLMLWSRRKKADPE